MHCTAAGPSYCQVEQCGEPLEGLKEYHQRYKVCEEHLKIPYIIRDGQQVRDMMICKVTHTAGHA
jgi:hypothetical protein